jgi:hypothetical protein
MVGDNEPWTRDGWAPDCHCGECRTCQPQFTLPANIVLGAE